MAKNITLWILSALTILFISIYVIKIKPKENQTIVSPYKIATVDKKEAVEIDPITKIKEEKKQLFGDVINILLIGTDTSTGRRERGQRGFNTDSMILVSMDIKTNRILLTSVPRDLWVNDNKINALYTVFGEEVLTDAFEKVTGQKVDGVIRVDFDQFIWLVDALGGVPINVETTFTDTSFPNQTDSNIETISFTQGKEVMDGWRALTFARSRKGNNGEGSDLMRAKRQHLILKGFVEGVDQEKSSFWPMDLEKFYTSITTQNIYTTLTLDDLYYLWDFYKDRDKYKVESLIVDGKYVYHPGMYPQSDFTAWVFIAKEPGFENLHKDIQDKLDGTYIDPDLVQATTEPTPTL